MALTDKEFDNIEDLVGLLETNTAVASEHVSKLDRCFSDEWTS